MQKGLNICELGSLEPWFSDYPWSAALKGKKVLVIHPFSETIQKQYKNREYIFPNTEILPEFELQTLKAVQTIAGEMGSRWTVPEYKGKFTALFNEYWVYPDDSEKPKNAKIVEDGCYW